MYVQTGGSSINRCFLFFFLLCFRVVGITFVVGWGSQWRRGQRREEEREKREEKRGDSGGKEEERHDTHFS
ncbi:hypothetical protein V8C26DRAFT_399742 [Trichoderma gracile]